MTRRYWWRKWLWALVVLVWIDMALGLVQATADGDPLQLFDPDYAPHSSLARAIDGPRGALALLMVAAGLALVVGWAVRRLRGNAKAKGSQ